MKTTRGASGDPCFARNKANKIMLFHQKVTPLLGFGIMRCNHTVKFGMVIKYHDNLAPNQLFFEVSWNVRRALDGPRLWGWRWRVRCHFCGIIFAASWGTRVRLYWRRVEEEAQTHERMKQWYCYWCWISRTDHIFNEYIMMNLYISCDNNTVYLWVIATSKPW
jgi:hypothetical protein